MNRSLVLLGAFFIVAGAAHFAMPNYYVKIMPPWLPAPMALVLISGVFEILGGVGVLVPAVRVAAGWGLIALLICVFPANIQMLMDGFRDNGSTLWKIGLVLRLPLQPLMVWWIYAAAIKKT